MLGYGEEQIYSEVLVRKQKGVVQRAEYSVTEPWIVTQTVPLTPALKERSHLSHTVYCAGHFQTRDRDGEGRGEITEPWITVGCWNIQHMWHKYKSSNSRVCANDTWTCCVPSPYFLCGLLLLAKTEPFRREKASTSVLSDRLIPEDCIRTVYQLWWAAC